MEQLTIEKAREIVKRKNYFNVGVTFMPNELEPNEEDCFKTAYFRSRNVEEALEYWKEYPNVGRIVEVFLISSGDLED